MSADDLNDERVTPRPAPPKPFAAPGGDQDLHDFVMPFGRHKGVRLVRVPVSYLTWMVGARVNHADLAERELGRRGTVIPTVEVSGHALDRASIYCRHFWHEDRKRTGEGLHGWLCRVAREALDKGEKGPEGKTFWAGMKFAFSDDTRWPVLLTVRPAKGKSLDAHK